MKSFAFSAYLGAAMATMAASAFLTPSFLAGQQPQSSPSPANSAKTMIKYMEIPTMKGVTAKTVATKRITTRVLFSGQDKGIPVLFLHGNLSSATWWEETMLALPPEYRGIAPDQRGFGAADTSKVVDAKRGAGDWADDAIALLDQLGAQKAHVVGSSLGGYVVWRLMADYPARLLSVTLVAPGSPYGFGGTKDTLGTPCFPDYDGTGAGLGNKMLIQAIKDGDRTMNSPFTPRAALRNFVVKPPFVSAREEELLSALMSVHLGAKALPGDVGQSENWPYFTPGRWGILNALSPKYAGEISKIWKTTPKVPVLWIRGADDMAVSNSAVSDIGTLGSKGVIPRYPGTLVYPPQPMLDQTRMTLRRYAERGGAYKEVVLENAGHVPYIEKPEEFNKHFHEFLRSAK